MIDVTGLRALQALAALGTLARAADALGFTPSAVSQQLKRLERELGVELIAPAGRRVVLTPAGQALADSATDVFSALERSTEAARSIAGGHVRGTVRIAAFSTALRGLVAPVMSTLAAEHPHLRVETVEQDPDEAVHSVEVGRADLAVIHDADGVPVAIPSTQRQRQVYVDAGDVIVAVTHTLAGESEPLTPSDLTGQAWVCSPPGTVCHQWFRRLTSQIPQPADVRHLVDDFSTQLALIAAGDVIGLIPRLARPPLGDALVARPLLRPPTRAVSLSWRRSADASPAIHAAVAALCRSQPPR